VRSIPNLVTLRPADGNETAQAWKIALQRQGPTALALTRQNLPQITPVDNGTAQGAYVLAEPKWVEPEVALIATGSEVELAMDAKTALADDGIAARVVSMPSWELFDAQSEEYRQSVLPPDMPRVAIETGSSLAWARYLGNQGVMIGLDHFGASAPYETIYEKFGFSVGNIVKITRELLGK